MPTHIHTHIVIHAQPSHIISYFHSCLFAYRTTTWGSLDELRAWAVLERLWESDVRESDQRVTACTTNKPADMITCGKNNWFTVWKVLPQLSLMYILHPSSRKHAILYGHLWLRTKSKFRYVWHCVLTLTRCTTGLGFSSSATARANVAICHGGCPDEQRLDNWKMICDSHKILVIQEF